MWTPWGPDETVHPSTGFSGFCHELARDLDRPKGDEILVIVDDFEKEKSEC